MTAATMIAEAIEEHELLCALPVHDLRQGLLQEQAPTCAMAPDIDIAVEYTGGGSLPATGRGPSRAAVRRERAVPGPGAAATSSETPPWQLGRSATSRTPSARPWSTPFGKAAVVRHNKVFGVRESERFDRRRCHPRNTFRRYLRPQCYLAGNPPHPRPTHRRQRRRLPPPSLPPRCAPRTRRPNCASSASSASSRISRITWSAEDGSEELPSFLIESLVCNAPDACFLDHDSWLGRLRAVLLCVLEDTEAQESEKRWMEVNGYKCLFGGHQRWTRAEARDFIASAAAHVVDT